MKLCGRQRTTWLSICSISGAEVCPNAGLSHRNLSKHEKNSPPSDQKRSGGGLFFETLLFYVVFIH